MFYFRIVHSLSVILLLAISLAIFGQWHLVNAAFLKECEGVVIDYIPNPNRTCSERIYCNYDNSYYCNGDCLEPVFCGNEKIDEPPTTTTILTTVETTTIAEITTTTQLETSAVPITTSAPQTLPTTLPATTTTTTTTTTVKPSTTTAPQTTTTALNTGSARDRCRKGHFEISPYPPNKNYYYQCIDGYLLLQQCPRNYYFEMDQKNCVPLRYK